MLFESYPQLILNLVSMMTWQDFSTVKIISATFSCLMMLYSLSNLLSFKTHGVNVAFSTQFWCTISSCLDLSFRLISMAYLFCTLSFYAFLLPITYIFFCFIFFSLKQSVGRAFRQLYHFCISFVTSAYRNPDFYNYRVLSKMIYNGLALVFLAVAFGVSLQNSDSSLNISLEECQNICNQNDTYLQNDGFLQNDTYLQNDTLLQNDGFLQNDTFLQNDVALGNDTMIQNTTLIQNDVFVVNGVDFVCHQIPEDQNKLLIALTCTLWLLSVFEGIIESRFSFMPWSIYLRE